MPETETSQSSPPAKAMGGTIPSKKLIHCGYRDCKFSHHYATVVGMHRRSAHNIKGTANVSIYAREKKQRSKTQTKQDDTTCKECGFHAKNALGLAIHQSGIHGIRGQKYQKKSDKGELPLNGNSANHSNEEAIAFHVARLTTRFEYDVEALAARLAITPEELASRCMAVLQRSSKTLRERYRLSDSV